MRPSDSRETGLPLPRASQVPRLLFLNAPSPVTPGNPSLAVECLFSDGFRLQQTRQLGHSQFHVTRPNRVHFCYGSLIRLPRLRFGDYSFQRQVGYMSDIQLSCWSPFRPIIGVGIARRPPLPPNRTCRFPAYGSPVTGLPARSSRTSAGQETALLACSTRQRLGEGCTDLLQCHSS